MAANQKPAIAITMGDPCGIGPEVVVKALADPRVYASCRPMVVGNTYAMQQAVKLTGSSLTINETDDPRRCPQHRNVTAVDRRQQVGRRDARQDPLGEARSDPVRAQQQVERNAFASGREAIELDRAVGDMGVDVECDGLPQIGQFGEGRERNMDRVADPDDVDDDAGWAQLREDAFETRDHRGDLALKGTCRAAMRLRAAPDPAPSASRRPALA